MPNHTYSVPGGRRPRLRDHALAHPGEVVIAAWSAFIGAMMLVQVSTVEFEPSPSLAVLPAWLTTSVAATLVAGGVIGTIGLYWPGRASTEWLLERIGWIVMSAGWASYAVSILKTYPGSLISVSFAVIVLSVAVLRLVALQKVEREIRARTCEGDE